jgi:hypothetical protein
VHVLDAAVDTILAPVGTVDSGTVVTPRVLARNPGTDTGSFWVVFRIHSMAAPLLNTGSTGALGKMHTIVRRSPVAVTPRGGETGTDAVVYAESLWVESLPPGSSRQDTFPDWNVASPPGTYACSSYTRLSGDMNRANDTAHGMVLVRATHDVGVGEILSPPHTVAAGDTVVPSAVVRNYGTVTETFAVRFTIGTSYSDDTTAAVAAGSADTVYFAEWIPSQVGTFVMRCSTMLAGDMNPANDRVIDTVVVVGTGVAEASQIPRAFAFDGGHPNPFSGRIALRYALPQDCRVNLRVCDATGTCVRVLTTADQRAGFYRAFWDGTDNSGRALPAGIYFCRLEAGGFSGEKKLILTK